MLPQHMSSLSLISAMFVTWHKAVLPTCTCVGCGPNVPMGIWCWAHVRVMLSRPSLLCSRRGMWVDETAVEVSGHSVRPAAIWPRHASRPRCTDGSCFAVRLPLLSVFVSAGVAGHKPVIGNEGV